MRQGILSEVGLFAGDFAPEGWMFSDGQRLPVAEYPRLFDALGRQHGGDDSTFGLPRLPDPVAHVRPIPCVDGVAADAEHVSNASRAILGEVRLIAGNVPLRGWHECQGQPVPTARFTALYSVVGEKFGGTPSQTFALPVLTPPLGGTRYVIALGGAYPDDRGNPGDETPDQTVGEIRLWPSARLPFGWAVCDGSALKVRSPYTPLFSVLGTTFGGDDDFRLPDARFNLPRLAPPIPGVGHVICVSGTFPRRP